MLAGPRSVAIQVVREREKYRSGNGGVIKRKVRVGGGGGLGVLVVRRNEMRHKSRADADEVQHFTLFRRVQVQTISGCCIRADAAHRLHHLFMAAVLLLRLFLLFCAHRNLVSLLPFHLIETLQRSPPSFIPQGNLVDPCFIKASPFFPLYRSSRPNPRRTPLPSPTRARLPLFAKVANAGCRGSGMLSMPAQVRGLFLLSRLIVWLISSRCRGPEQLRPAFAHICAQKKRKKKT